VFTTCLINDPIFSGTGYYEDNSNPVSFFTSPPNPDTERVITIYAYFRECVEVTKTVAPVGGGSIAFSPLGTCGANHFYGAISSVSPPFSDDGTNVVITATPAPGYTFDHWDGDLTGTTNPQTLLVDAPKAVTAYFTSTTAYNLATGVDPLGSGSVTLSPPGGSYVPDTVVEVTAVPGGPYDFDHWEGDLGGSTNPQSLTMDSDKSVTAFMVTPPPPVVESQYAACRVVGSYLFIADQANSKLKIYNVGTPTSPSLVAQLVLDNPPTDLELINTTLAIAAGDNVYFVTIDDITNPQLAAAY